MRSQLIIYQFITQLAVVLALQLQNFNCIWTDSILQPIVLIVLSTVLRTGYLKNLQTTFNFKLTVLTIAQENLDAEAKGRIECM